MADASKTWPQLVLFGDSHFQRGFAPTESIGSRLADALQRRCDVVSRGFSGYNTKLVKLLLPEIFTDRMLESVAGVVILLGSNDAAVEVAGERTNQYLPLEEYRKNLEDIVGFLTDHGLPKERIILVSPPPVDAAAWLAACESQGKKPSPRDNAKVASYAVAVYEVAKSQGTFFLDLHERMFTQTDQWRSFFSDGLHLNEKGSQAFFENLWPVVERILKPYPNRFPDWTTVDFANPEASFAHNK